MAESGQARHRPAIPITSAHDARVEFVGALCGVHRAATGIEEAVILEDFNGGYYGGNGISVLFKYGCSCLERCSERFAVGALRFFRKDLSVEMSGPAVDGDGPSRWLRLSLGGDVLSL